MGFNFVNLLGSYIPIFYVFGGDKIEGARLLGINGTVWAITGVLAVFPLNIISPRFGKRNTLIIAMLLMCVAQLSKIVCYNPNHPYLVLIPTILLSAGMLFFFTLGSSMVGDICDEDELNTGHRSEGSYYSIYWWFIKLGTAFASFVAGILITLTLFDQTQVTKVDSLQGSIRDMQSKIEFWEGYDGSAASLPEGLKTARQQTSDALKEARDYLLYLDNEAIKKPEKKRSGRAENDARRRNVMLNTSAATGSLIRDLEDVDRALATVSQEEADSLIGVAVPLIMQSKLNKARIYSYDLLAHLEARTKQHEKSKEHTTQLTGSISAINNRINELDADSSPDILGRELASVEKDIEPLKKQSPYTLLMMRVVEIGLPLLLSLLALFFAVRYSLTEKRSFEIKELLMQRNRENNNGEGQAARPPAV
jgi:hypothetical protein